MPAPDGLLAGQWLHAIAEAIEQRELTIRERLAQVCPMTIGLAIFAADDPETSSHAQNE